GAGDVVSISRYRDEDEVLGAEGRGQRGNLAGLREDRLEVLVRTAHAGHRPAGAGEVPGGELVGQLARVGRQVAVRAELEPPVAGPGQLVEEPVPRRLPRVVGEPDAPRVGAAAELEVASVSGHDAVSLVNSREVQRGAVRGVDARPARGDDLAAGVERDALG